MSRIGQKPITIPAGVEVSTAAKEITVKGPGGQLQLVGLDKVSWQIADQEIRLSRADDSRLAKARHGLLRSLVANMVIGVSQGFKKQLELNGIGFRVQVNGNNLVLNVGFSHPVNYRIPEDVQVSVERNLITVAGIDKQRVGQVAAEIRAIKKPEPYKGKGIKYQEEVIVRKAGKGGREA